MMWRAFPPPLHGCARANAGPRPGRRNDHVQMGIIFAVIALVAALLGFGGIAGLSADFAKILLIIAAVLFVVALVFGRGRRTLP